METGTMALEDLAKLVANYSSLSYRFIAQRINGDLRGTRLILGAPSASWTTYTYANALFLAGHERGSVVSEWLTKAQITTRYHQSYPLLPLSSQATFARQPSHTSYDLFMLPKPYTFFRIAFSEAVSAQESLLVSEHAPFFLTVSEAERVLLYDKEWGSIVHGNDRTPDHGITVYLERDEAWLEKIHFSSSVLQITLNGTALSSTKLKVIGTGIQEYDDYPSEKTITLSAPNGPPDAIKVVLLKGNTWLDYFYHDASSRNNPFARKHTNVVFDYQEPGEEIMQLIEAGEGRMIEFKGEESDDQDKWLKTVVAFANTAGGHILFGVNDEGQLVGLQKEIARYGSIEKFRDSLTNTIANVVTPVPYYEFLPIVKMGGNEVLVIKVTSDDQAHSLYFKKTPVFYIRRDATTRAANNFEVQELVRLKDALKNQKTQRDIL